MDSMNTIHNYVLLTLDEPQLDGTIIEDTPQNREVIDAFIERVHHSVVYGEYTSLDEILHGCHDRDVQADQENIHVSYHNARMQGKQLLVDILPVEPISLNNMRFVVRGMGKYDNTTNKLALDKIIRFDITDHDSGLDVEPIASHIHTLSHRIVADFLSSSGKMMTLNSWTIKTVETPHNHGLTPWHKVSVLDEDRPEMVNMGWIPEIAAWVGNDDKATATLKSVYAHYVSGILHHNRTNDVPIHSYQVLVNKREKKLYLTCQHPSYKMHALYITPYDQDNGDVVESPPKDETTVHDALEALADAFAKPDADVFVWKGMTISKPSITPNKVGVTLYGLDGETIKKLSAYLVRQLQNETQAELLMMIVAAGYSARVSQDHHVSRIEVTVQNTHVYITYIQENKVKKAYVVSL